VLYKVKWSNSSTRTWEPAANIVVGRTKLGRKLYEDWKNRVVPLNAFQQSEEDLLTEPEPEAASALYSGPLPVEKKVVSQSSTQHSSNMSKVAPVAAAPAEAAVKKSSTCHLRGSDTPSQRFGSKTGGAIYAVCACGYPLAPMELPGACELA
jgi:hypothetical protein